MAGRGQGKDGENLGWKEAECQWVAVEPGGFFGSVAWLELRGAEEGPEEEAEARLHPKPAFWLSGLRFHVTGKAPAWGQLANPSPPTAPSRRWAFSVLNKNDVGNFPQ